MKITFLDAATLGADVREKIDEIFGDLGKLCIRLSTKPEEVEEVIADSDVVILNKIKLNESNLKNAKNLKLICATATGYDNIDVKWCGENGIAVCNVVGYSTQSVAQLTISMALMLFNHMSEYVDYVKDGSYTKSGIANCLSPTFREIHGKVWGIVGAGNIGKQVARVAEALGCKVIVNKRKPDGEFEFADLDTLCKTADIISVHTPLNEETKHLISRERIAMMKKDAILINVARGLVTDEEALADAIEKEMLGGIGIDVYSVEPMPKDHPFTRIMGRNNVCLTPHNAWGAYEARVRCLEIIKDNIEKFLKGEKQNRVD